MLYPEEHTFELFYNYTYTLIGGIKFKKKILK